MSIKILVNGKKELIADNTTVSLFLKNKKIRPEIVTIELNDDILDKKFYDTTILKDKDRVELVFYMGGGGEGKNQKTNIKYQNKKLKNNVTDLIGNTPMIKLNHIVDDNTANIYAKLEMFNPGGSVKDRICLSMIESAEKNGRLKPGGTIVEPTSGNTGIGLAMIGSAKGYKVILVMPETMSLERIYILKSYGAEVILTSGKEGMLGSIKKAEEIVKKTKAFMPQQFKNPANPEIHRKTTAVEILESLGPKIDAFVAGVGTGGTITGVGEVLKSKNPNIKIIAVEPAASAVISGSKPGPHKIQGIGAGFIPEVLNTKIIDEIVTVTDNDAFQTAKNLAKKEGLFVGISSGAAAFAAIKIAKVLGKNKSVVTIFPDTGERYFSITQYFEG